MDEPEGHREGGSEGTADDRWDRPLRDRSNSSFLHDIKSSPIATTTQEEGKPVACDNRGTTAALR